MRVDFCEESGYWGFTLHLKKEDRQFFCKSEDDRKVWVKAIKTSVRDLGKTIKKLNKHGYKGVNLTIPLKEEALKYLDRKDKVVSITGAANVLIFSNQGQIEGKNTDVYGFKKSLINLVKNKKRETAIVIGGGGAARVLRTVTSP